MSSEHRINLPPKETPDTQKVPHTKGHFRWAPNSVIAGLLASTLLLIACQSPPQGKTDSIPEIAVPVAPVGSKEESAEARNLARHTRTITDILQEILQPEIYQSLTDKRLITMQALSSSMQMTSEDYQLIHQTVAGGTRQTAIGFSHKINGVWFNFQKPPASLVYGGQVRFDVLINTAEENNPSKHITAYKVALEPYFIQTRFEREFWPGLAFAMMKRPVGIGEMGTDPGIIKSPEGGPIYRVLIRENMGLYYAFGEKEATLPAGW